MKIKRSVAKKSLNLIIAVALIALSACAYQGGGDQPVIRKFTWFSYLAGDDIRQTCAAKGERYRLVYNAVYNEQVRTYDVRPTTAGRYQIKISVTGAADVSAMALALNNPDLFQPWRPVVSVTNIPATDLKILKKTLKNAGFFDSSPPHENIPSISFYWLVSACTNGKFYQNAYLWPSEKFKRAQFGKLLSAWDFTGIPHNPPRETSDFSVYGTTDTAEYQNHFNLRFGSDGLLLHTTLN